MQSVHIVVLPSYREGLPKVLIEAAACARAVITADVPGCRDAVEPGSSALLVPARDSRSLAEAMQALIADRALCARMGIAGRELAERCFSISDVVTAHMKIYSEIAAPSS
jgi:glycosyltransferase involved in cell wall biosynthesis